MISGSDSIDLYYLKYFTNRAFDTTAASNVTKTSTTSSADSVSGVKRFAHHSIPGSFSFTSCKATSASLQPQQYFDSCCCLTLIIETVNMLIVRLAIILSLVGWRVKPDPGD